MKNIAYALMIPAICVSLSAESTGRISVKVTNKAGTPIANAKVLLERERSEVSWSKELVTDSDGKVMQVGLVPKNYDITVSAEGFAPMKIKRKVPLAETLSETFVLLTPTEARAAGAPGAPVDPGAAKEAESSEAYNAAVSFYNEQNYAAALPLIETAYKTLVDAVAATKDATTKTELETRLPMLERIYGISLIEVGKLEEGQEDAAKKAMILKAEPFLLRTLERTPKDQRILAGLITVATVKGDAVMLKKHQDALDAIIGPRPELAYNDAVSAFNAGNFKKAKSSVTTAIATDPKFADSYWLLGVVEFSLGSTKAAKEAFKKYMEIAPTGKKAGEVKEFLKELK